MALTKRQKQVLDFIAGFIDENGYCPSYEEIAGGLGLASLATVHKHISVLEAKNYLKRGFNQSRSLELAPKYVQEQRRTKPPALEIPLLGRIAAGAPVESVEQQEMLNFADFAAGGNTFALEVRGNSMIDDHICDGDLILLERVAEVRDGDIAIAPIAAGFAAGRLTGRARVWGRGADRRLSAEGSLVGANLRQAIASLNTYSAGRNRRAPPSLGQFVKDKADIRLDVSVSAEGRFDDPFSFQGAGTAQVSGPDLGNVRMLGLLSELLSFTSLRFTSAGADFQIKGNRLDFPRLAVSGANSGIDARGTYFLDSHRLDFKARINPLKESKGLAQEVIGAVLTPISSALEVSLTGSVESPRWAFVNSPVNLLRPKTNDAEAPKPASPAQ